MNKNEVTTIALKLLGIYIIVQALASIGTAVGIYKSDGLDNWSPYLGALIYFIAGVMLIFKAEIISKLTFQTSENSVDKLDVSENFQKGALRVLGIYIAISSIPSLVHIIGQIVQYELILENIPDYLKEHPNYIVPLVSQSVRFLLGLFLALGASSVIKALSRFDQTIKNLGT